MREVVIPNCCTRQKFGRLDASTGKNQDKNDNQCFYRWTALEELPQKIVPFKASIYQAVAENFGPLIRERRQNNRLDEGWWSRR